ncbi:MAG: competence/damage-inducible protein A [Deltaproteobacteria bacterium]|nr:competence/damage-inducible protein A [Deltaproteobacteria bacterium]
MEQEQAQIPSVGIVVIGNEILSGKVADTNSAYLCREMAHLGPRVDRVVVIPDDMEIIGSTVNGFSGDFTWVFTSGGVGPTHDDVTVGAIARAKGKKLISHPELEEGIRKFYRERLTERHLRMALVPEGAELIHGGELFFPVITLDNIFILPGVPELFRLKFAAIKERFRATPCHLREVFLKTDEGRIAQLLEKTAAENDTVLIGSYPSLFRDDYSVKVTLEGRDSGLVERVFHDLCTSLEALQVQIVRKV